MQGRMKEHQLTEAEIRDFLSKVPVGRLGTLNEDGYPYIVPVHFYYEQGHIFIHGLKQGQKIENLKKRQEVCFETDEMFAIIPDENVCDTNTSYNSVIALGEASVIEDESEKTDVLNKIVRKYTPHLEGHEFQPGLYKATGIIDIKLEKITGKYYLNPVN